MVVRAVVLAALLLASAAALAQPESRVALVVGNGLYRAEIGRLANPENDARAIGAALERRGFTVLLALDATLAELRQALRAFAGAAARAEVALLYFAGHAIEVGGRNYLLPVDFALGRDGSAPLAVTLSLDEIARVLSGLPGEVLILLDACRNDPFAGAASSGRGISAIPGTGPGLAPEVAVGLTVVYATSPGRVALDGAGAHSPFATAILHHLGQANIGLREFLGRIRLSVSEATSGAQVPSWPGGGLPTTPLLGPPREAHWLLRMPTEARPSAAGARPQPFGALTVAAEPAPPPARLLCQTALGRGWARTGGQGRITMSQDGPACGGLLYAEPGRLIPADNLRVVEAPAHGRVVIRDNGFAYAPNPGFAGQDAFRIEAWSAHLGGIALRGRVEVTVRPAH